MSGTRITDQEVRLYVSKRKHHSREIAAAKAGISVRSARRIERDATRQLASETVRRLMTDAGLWDPTSTAPALLAH
jgi:riboflavin biosynthesis pyrimidine reductase